MAAFHRLSRTPPPGVEARPTPASMEPRHCAFPPGPGANCGSPWLLRASTASWSDQSGALPPHPPAAPPGPQRPGARRERRAPGADAGRARPRDPGRARGLMAATSKPPAAPPSARCGAADATASHASTPTEPPMTITSVYPAGHPSPGRRVAASIVDARHRGARPAHLPRHPQRGAASRVQADAGAARSTWSSTCASTAWPTWTPRWLSAPRARPCNTARP